MVLTFSGGRQYCGAGKGRKIRWQRERPAMLGDAVDRRQQLVDDGDQGNFGRFAGRTQALIVSPQPGIMMNRRQRRHPQCAPQPRIAERHPPSMVGFSAYRHEKVQFTRAKIENTGKNITSVKL